MSAKDSKTFCPLPWTHIHSWPSGEGYLCCVAGCSKQENVMADFTKESIVEAMNNDKMKQVRLAMAAGEQITACDGCYKSEELYGKSFRTSNIETHNHRIDEYVDNMNEDGSLKDPRLTYIDFRFSNLCNLECRSCGGDLSSKILEKDVKFHRRDDLVNLPAFNSNNNTISFLNINPGLIDELKGQIRTNNRYYFAGGEPLIQDAHLELINAFVDQDQYDLYLSYSTNLSTLKYKGVNFLDIWKKFKEVLVYGSIDDFGPRLEYIRFRSNWDRMKKNVEALVAASKTNNAIRFTFSQVISIFNIYYIPEFLTEMIRLRAFVDCNSWLPQHILGSEWMHPGCLPKEMKLEVEQKLNGFILQLPSLGFSVDDVYIITGKLNDIIINMNTYEYPTQLFLDGVNTDDLQKGTDFRVTVPWLSNLLIK
jgi:organic radical activating enzyme